MDYKVYEQVSMDDCKKFAKAKMNLMHTIADTHHREVIREALDSNSVKVVEA